jgi:hypothetical protein
VKIHSFNATKRATAVVQSEMDPRGWTASTGFLVANPTAPVFPYHSAKGFVFCSRVGGTGQRFRRTKPVGAAIASQATAEAWPAEGCLVGAIALPIRAGAGWHGSRVCPCETTSCSCRRRPPRRSRTRSILRKAQDDWLGHGVPACREAILDACCGAWRALTAKSEVIA